MTGGRLLRAAPFIGEEDFCFTYGDGVADIDITALVKSHLSDPSALVTVTSVRPPGRFGGLEIGAGSSVKRFLEKPAGDGMRINGGFFVVSPEALQYITGDDSVWEGAPLSMLAEEGKLKAYNHDGYWQPMDTLREKETLEKLWKKGSAPWKVW